MKNDEVLVNYFYGKEVRSSFGENKSCYWIEFVKKFKKPIKQNITIEKVRELTKYKGLSSTDLKNLSFSEKQLKQKNAVELLKYKNIHYIVPSSFDGNERKAEKQISRNIIAFDIDNVNNSIWDKLKVYNSFEYVLHTSFSHTQEKPKIRMYFLLNEHINNKKDYEKVVTNLIYKHGLKFEDIKKKVGEVDKASIKYNQLMFLPNVSSNGEYKYKYNKGKTVVVSDYLQENISINNLKKEIKTDKIKSTKEIQEIINQIKSPYDMNTLIGQFCQKYNIHVTISKWLNHIYIDRNGNSYTYALGSTKDGLKVYSDNKGNNAVFAYSYHGTDDMNDTRCHNSFDILKVHKFNGNNDKTIQFIKNILNPEKNKNETKEEILKITNSLDFLNNFNKHKENYNKQQVYSTGIDVLDKCLNGGFRNYLYVLGAGSSMGKTTFVQQLTDNIAKKGNKVLFFSMEQTTLELTAKGLSRLTYLNDKNNALNHLQIMEGEQCCNINECIEEYKKYSNNINYVEAEFGTNMIDIEKTIEAFIKKNKKQPLVIIDYLQVLGFMNDRDSDKRAVEQNIKKLKSITKKLKCPVVVLSSLNRDSYLIPLSYESFKETGGIEYTCDTLFGLQYRAVHNLNNNTTKKVESRKALIEASNSREYREIEFVCLKNRSGKQHFNFNMKYFSEFNYFCEEQKNKFELIKKEGENNNPFKQMNIT